MADWERPGQYIDYLRTSVFVSVSTAELKRGKVLYFAQNIQKKEISLVDDLPDLAIGRPSGDNIWYLSGTSHSVLLRLVCYNPGFILDELFVNELGQLEIRSMKPLPNVGHQIENHTYLKLLLLLWHQQRWDTSSTAWAPE